MVGWLSYAFGCDVRRVGMIRPAGARAFGSVCGAVLLGSALPSVAMAHQGLADAAYTPELSVTLVGRIEDRCSISGGGTLALGELTPGEAVSADFSLDCNVPFDIRILSANGGLTHLTKPEGEGPFAGRLPYDLQVRIPTLSPGASTLRGSFSSSELSAEAVMSSGLAVAASGLSRLALTTRNIPGPGLLAGDYSEMLTVSVAPRI